MAAGRVKIPPRPAPRSDAREFSHSLGAWEREPEWIALVEGVEAAKMVRVNASPHLANDVIVRELASLAAQRILEAPVRVREGLERLARWRLESAGRGRDAAFAEWEEIIRSRTPAEIATLLVAEGDEAQRLRSSMPFIRAPFFSEEERQEVIARAFQS